MKTYLISYDLRVPETSEDYKRLINYIKRFDGWSKPLKSVWLINTNLSVSAVRDELKIQTDNNDGILVIDVTDSDWATIGISNEVTDWMNKNL